MSSMVYAFKTRSLLTAVHWTTALVGSAEAVALEDLPEERETGTWVTASFTWFLGFLFREF